jgi:hypothetical protein
MTASGTTISEMPFLLQDSNDKSAIVASAAIVRDQRASGCTPDQR